MSLEIWTTESDLSTVCGFGLEMERLGCNVIFDVL